MTGRSGQSKQGRHEIVDALALKCRPRPQGLKRRRDGFQASRAVAVLEVGERVGNALPARAIFAGVHGHRHERELPGVAAGCFRLVR